MIPFLDLKAQYASIKDDIQSAIGRVLESTQFVLGPEVAAFEEEFAAYSGAHYGVAVNSGTSALHLALLAAGVGPGDEVITIPFTFVATVQAIRYTGAVPVFVDIDPATFTMDPAKLEAAITPRTKVILPVHLYGHSADMDPIVACARRHGLTVIEDACQAHGARYKNRPVGSLGDFACFSFYPGKNLGAYGDAGALVTNNEEWAASARMLANHGRTKKYDHDWEGVNSRLDGLQAAVLNVKLRHIEHWTERRRTNAALYNEALKESGIVTPREPADVRAVYHLYVVRVPDGRREALQEHLKANGIQTGIHYPIALPFLNAYRYLGHSAAEFPEALKASSEILSLPMFPELTADQVAYTAARIRECQSR